MTTKCAIDYSSKSYEIGYMDAREGRSMRSIAFFGMDAEANDYVAGYESGQMLTAVERNAERARLTQ